MTGQRSCQAIWKPPPHLETLPQGRSNVVNGKSCDRCTLGQSLILSTLPLPLPRIPQLLQTIHQSTRHNAHPKFLIAAESPLNNPLLPLNFIIH